MHALLGHLKDIAALRGCDARIVDKNIESSEPVERRIDKAAPVLLRGDVRADINRFRRELLQLTDIFRRLFRSAARGGDNGKAVRGKL